MPARGKIWACLFFILILLFFCFSPKFIFASEVMINEFAAVTEGTSQNPDWIELYNPGDTEINLDGWIIRDSSETNKINLEGLICPKSFRKFDFSNRLNNDGDKIRLFDNKGDLIEEIAYFSDEIPEHKLGQSTSRSPDGGVGWIVLTEPTPSNDECGFTSSTPTSTPTLTFTPTNTPTPSPTPTSVPKAVYKINEVKDNQGNKISNAKVYLDGVYLHHYAPEILVFCQGCKCDTYVDCEFGKHRVELQKDGYYEWSEEIEIKPGDNLEVNPVMEKEEVFAPASTPTPLPLPLTPTPTREVSSTLSPVLSLNSNLSSQEGEVLGKQAESIDFYPLEKDINKESSSEEALNPKNPTNKLGKIMILFGAFCFLVASFLSFVYQGKIKLFSGKN